MTRAVALVTLVWLAVGCGPIAYVNEVTRRAQTSVDDARAAQADKYAPYYWTRATFYLHEARVCAARSDFQGANRFGRLSSEAGDLAVVEAKAVKADPSKGPLLLDTQSSSPSVAPAKVAPAKDDVEGGL